MNKVTDRIAGLSATKRSLLGLKLKTNGTATSSDQSIPRRATGGPAALSFAQQRLWFLHQLEPESPLYNISRAIRLSGALNVEALQKSLDAIVARHEILRTNIVAADGNPVQMITDSKPVRLEINDLCNLSDSDHEAEIPRLLNAEAQRPFDLSSDLMLRATLLRLRETDHVLLLVMHHIASDSWSMGILLRELSAFYKAFSLRKPYRLHDLPIQYADFAVPQRQWLQGELLERQLSYWKQQLSGAPAVLELPTDRPRPTIQSSRRARQSFRLLEELTQALKQLSQREGVTLFMTLLAAFQTLLYRYTGQKDIVVGSPIVGRTRAETESLIGFFVNTLVLRTELSGRVNFRQLMARVREVVLGAYGHQDLPFEKLVEELQPDRDRSHNPLFQVFFALQNVPRQPLELTDLIVSPLDVDSETAKFDLTLVMIEEGHALTGSIEYNTDLFEDTTIIRMLGHFQTLLEGIVADPEQRLSDIPILTEKERHQMLVEWNDTKTDYPKDKCIHQLFETQVERCPDTIAVVFENQQLTYRELNRRANQLAHHLRALGAGPEILVGIFMERSLEMVIGLLAILKAGGAYVPLDPSYPMERLDFMLEDARVRMLLTQQRLVERLPNHQAQVVCLDTDWENIAKESSQNPVSGVTADNLVYVIYTSGSTGRPKGAMNIHRGICNRLLWMQDAYQLTRADHVLQKTPFGFDVSVWEFFWPLITGSRLVVARPGGHQDAAYLVKLISEQRITTVHFVPPMLQIFLEEKALEGCSCLRLVICSGEALPFELQQRFFARLDAELPNLYGPTEAAVDVTSWSCERRGDRRVVPIGRPIANTQIYLLNSHLQPVPMGVSGELHIGGAGLARGYLNQPELTAEKFIPNPFRKEPGARLYKTGDLARYLSDGNIEFLGRIDDQVKIRGFRVELGEIEMVLGQHHAVQQVTLVAREDVFGDKRLVAYVVPQPQATPTTGELQSFLKARVPDHMVPSGFVFLDALPLTLNGKIDRRTLPAPDQNRPAVETTFVAPRDALELQLTNIWEKTLGIQPVGVKDNFFDLGGHSLLAVRLFARIEKTFGKNVPLTALFQASTIEQLANFLREEKPRVPWSSLVALQPRGSKPPFFWVHGDYSNALLPRYLDPDQPLYGLEHQSQDGKRALYTQVETIAAHYLKEIRTVQTQGPYLLGGYSFGGTVAFEMAQQLNKQGEKVALLFLLDSQFPGNSKSLSPVNSRSPNILANVTLFRDEVHRHLHNLALLGPQEKLSYLLVRVKGIIKGTIKGRTARISKIQKKLGWKVYLAMGRPLPLFLRSSYILDIYSQARLKYAPQLYAGQAIYIKCEEGSGDDQSDWCRLMAGGLEVYEVPGGHTDIIKEQNARLWAEKLKACLHRAQKQLLDKVLMSKKSSIYHFVIFLPPTFTDFL